MNHSEDPAEVASRDERAQRVRRALRRILPRQRLVLLLGDMHDWPATKVADALGATRYSVEGLCKRGRTALLLRLLEERLRKVLLSGRCHVDVRALGSEMSPNGGAHRPLQ